MANCHLIYASLASPAILHATLALRPLAVQPGARTLHIFPTPQDTKWCFNDLVCAGFWLTHVGITECIVIL